MLFQELIDDERADAKAEGRAEGRAEAILEILQYKGEVSEELKEKILGERNMDILGDYFKLALSVSSVENFEKNI